MLDATPQEMQREDLIAVVANNSRGKARPTIAKAVDLFLDPTRRWTNKGAARDIGISVGTARAWRDLMVAFLEKTDAGVTVDGNTDLTPSPEALDSARIEAEIHAQDQRTGANNPNTTALSSADVADLIDRTIRRLDEDNAPGAAIKSMLELKIKFEDLEAARSENVQDPYKVLGPNGLADLIPTMLERFRLLLTHRREMPTFWEPMVVSVANALTADLKGPTPYELPDDMRDAITSLVFSLPDHSSAPTGEGAQFDVEFTLFDEDPALAAERAWVPGPPVFPQVWPQERIDMASKDASDDMFAQSVQNEFDPLPEGSRTTPLPDAQPVDPEKVPTIRAEEVDLENAPKGTMITDDPIADDEEPEKPWYETMSSAFHELNEKKTDD